ncbi:MAG: phage holin family protein [Ginsengibacter sp.]
MKFLTRLLITAAVVYGLSIILDPHLRIASFGTALIFALVLAFLNAILKPILIILTLPITILTLGIFLIVINVLMILLAAKFVDGFYIQGFWWALIFGILQSFFTSIILKMTSKK